MDRIEYPSEDKIVELNLLILTIIKVKKADKAKVLSHVKISEALDECKSFDGDVYDKAAVLMSGLIKKHPFASGNRRTAFIVAKYFLKQNNRKIKIRDDPKHAKVMQGIREDYYTLAEIKEWIKNGRIREFKR